MPNQELTGAKFELQGGERWAYVHLIRGSRGQPPYNLPAARHRLTPQTQHMCLLAHFNN